MSQRKLQQEIDRIFKKVKEGLEEFDFIYDKFQECDNQSQKEKLEGDLKKEIKKLQRHREQIKNWLNGNEVKDKTALTEHRRLIETEMERFKDVEKAMKTKAFSNEALASTSDNIDPRKKEKIECGDFIQGNIEELQRQMEAIEAKIDSLASSNKKKKVDSSKLALINANNEQMERHKWHISMLESVLRHLENDNIDVEQINEIKDDIEYYVESNQDPNFVEDDTFYDILGLDDMEDSFAVIPTDELVESSSPSPQPQPQPTTVTPMIKKVIKKREELAAAPSAPVPTTPISSLASQLQQPHLNMGSNNYGGVDSPKLKPLVTTLKPAQPVEAPKLKYSTVVAAAAAAAAMPAVAVPGLVSTPKKSNTPVQNFSSLTLDESTGPSTPRAPRSAPVGTSASQITHSYFSGDLNPVFNFEDDANFDKLPIEVSKYVKTLNFAKERVFEFKEQESFHVPSKKSLPPPKVCEIKLPKLEDIIQHLETSLLTCPDSHDADKPFKYSPVNPFVTQFSYPIEPLMDLYSPKIMEMLEFDTLQYIFYYQGNQTPSQFSQFSNPQIDSKRNKNDYIRWLAGNELRKRGWNFYKRSNYWVNKDDDGELKCFDFYDSWLIRSQLNFNPSSDEIESADGL